MTAGAALARGFALVTGGRVAGVLISLIQVKLAVSYLGPAGYGELTTVVLFTGLFEAFTDLGISTVIVRRSAGSDADLEKQVGLSMALSLTYGLPLVAVCDICGIALYHGQPEIVFGIVLLSIGLAASTWSTCYAPVAQVRTRFGAYSAAEVTSRLLALGVTAATVSMGLGIRWLMFGLLIHPLARFVALELWGRGQGRFRPVWDPAAMLLLTKEVLPFAYILGVGMAYSRLDGLLLSKLSTLEEVGAYGLAYRIAGQLTIIAPIAGSVLIARFAEDWAAGVAKFAATVRASMRLLLVASVPVAVLCWPYSDDAIRLVGSGEFVKDASRPLILLFIAVAIGMMTGLISAALVVANQQRVLAKLNTATLLVNLGLNLALIPPMGAEGAGIALVVSEGIGFCVSVWWLGRISAPVFDWTSSLLTAVSAGVAVAVGFALQGWYWLATAPLVLVVYAAAQLGTGNVSLRTLRGLRTDS